MCTFLITIKMNVTNWMSVLGTLYRLPCSSTMSTYVPPSTGSQRTDVRPSTSSQSFTHCGGISSMYSLSEPIFRSSQASNLTAGSNEQHLIPNHNHREDPARTCHHLYWNRALPGSRISTAPSATPSRNNQGMHHPTLLLLLLLRHFYYYKR